MAYDITTYGQKNVKFLIYNLTHKFTKTERIFKTRDLKRKFKVKTHKNNGKPSNINNS